jgi:hypothetical protein
LSNGAIHHSPFSQNTSHLVKARKTLFKSASFTTAIVSSKMISAFAIIQIWSFKFLLQNATEAGIHEPKDYKKKPVEYCSMTIKDNPFFE